MYCRCDGEKYTEFIEKNLRYTTEHLVNKIRNLGTFVAVTAEDKIRVYNKCISLIELIYDDGDYGFAFYHLGHIHCLIAKLYYEMKDTENAVLHLEKGLRFSKAYDELPTKVTHTSLLLQNDIEDLSEVYNGTQMNRVAYEIEEFKKASDATDLETAFSNIINKYAEFAKTE